MATCYHCAAYIPPGEGVRREVTTSRQSRTWVSSRPGGSYGVTSGLRTLCVSCASQLDQQREGGGVRAAVLVVGWLICALVGFRLAAQNQIGGLTMLFLFAGGPVWIVLWVLGWRHQREIDERNGYQALEPEPEAHRLGSPAWQANARETRPLSASSQEEDLLTEPYPGITDVVQEMNLKFQRLGIAWLRCNGYKNTLDGYRYWVKAWVARYPVAEFGGLEGWSELVYGQTLERFRDRASRDFDRLQACLDVEEVDQDACWEALKPLLEIFPLKQDEELGDHWQRLQAVLSQVTDELAEREVRSKGSRGATSKAEAP